MDVTVTVEGIGHRPQAGISLEQEPIHLLGVLVRRPADERLDQDVMGAADQPDQGPMSPLPGQRHQERVIALPDRVDPEVGRARRPARPASPVRRAQQSWLTALVGSSAGALRPRRARA